MESHQQKMKKAKQEEMSAEWAAMARACRGCDYQAGGKYCDYIGIVGHRRPCPPGKDCTVKKVTGKKQAPDYVKIAALYEDGLDDREIAKGARCSIAAVGRWRKEQSLPPNKKRSS